MDGKKAIPGKKPINYIMQGKHAPDTTTFAVSRLKMGTGLMPESYSSLCKAHSQFRTTPAAAPIQIQNKKQLIKLIGHDPLTKLAHAELPSKTHTKANHRRLSRRATPNWFFEMNLAHDVELNVSCTSPGVTSKERPRRLASERNPRTARQRWSLPQLGHTSSCMLDTTNQPNSICRMVSLQVTTVADHTRTLNEGPHAALGTVALACHLLLAG